MYDNACKETITDVAAFYGKLSWDASWDARTDAIIAQSAISAAADSRMFASPNSFSDEFRAPDVTILHSINKENFLLPRTRRAVRC